MFMSREMNREGTLVLCDLFLPLGIGQAKRRVRKEEMSSATIETASPTAIRRNGNSSKIRSLFDDDREHGGVSNRERKLEKWLVGCTMTNWRRWRNNAKMLDVKWRTGKQREREISLIHRQSASSARVVQCMNCFEIVDGSFLSL